MLERVIQNHPMILNAVCAASAMSSRKDWHTGESALPEAAIDKHASQPGLGRWVSRFAFYGRDSWWRRRSRRRRRRSRAFLARSSRCPI